MFIEFSERVLRLIENLWPKLPGLLLTLAIGFLLIKFGLFLVNRVLRIFRFSKAVQGLALSLASIVLWVMLIAEIARQAGLSNLAITISSSVFALGFAIANGASAMAADIIAGLSLAKDKDFECGYRIRVGDIEGIVTKIDVRKVRIKDDKGNINVIPNSKIDSTTGWSVLDRNPKA
jgi:small-conductance mechanosensitive channel